MRRPQHRPHHEVRQHHLRMWRAWVGWRYLASASALEGRPSSQTAARPRARPLGQPRLPGAGVGRRNVRGAASCGDAVFALSARRFFEGCWHRKEQLGSRAGGGGRSMASPDAVGRAATHETRPTDGSLREETVAPGHRGTGRGGRSRESRHGTRIQSSTTRWSDQREAPCPAAASSSDEADAERSAGVKCDEPQEGTGMQQARNETLDCRALGAASAVQTGSGLVPGSRGGGRRR